MVLHMSFKHMKASNTIKAYANEKSERLAKYFRGRTSLTWNFSVEKVKRVAHCHLVGNNMDFFGEAATEDLRVSIDRTVDKIERQIRRHKEIVKDHLHRNGHRLPKAS